MREHEILSYETGHTALCVTNDTYIHALRWRSDLEVFLIFHLFFLGNEQHSWKQSIRLHKGFDSVLCYIFVTISPAVLTRSYSDKFRHTLVGRLLKRLTQRDLTNVRWLSQNNSRIVFQTPSAQLKEKQTPRHRKVEVKTRNPDNKVTDSQPISSWSTRKKATNIDFSGNQ